MVHVGTVYKCMDMSCTLYNADMEFGGHILDSLINNNTHESTILKVLNIF